MTMFRCGGQIVCAHFVCCFLLLVFRHGSSLSVRGGVPVFQDFPEGVAASDGTAVVDDDPWAPVTQAINDYHMQDFAVVVTNSSGVQYLYEKGNISYTDTVMNVASTTKWVSGTMIMRVVASGALRLNDYCHTFFPWWTRDSSDPRSRVQLKHLLSFTSGYYQLTYGASVPCFRNASMDYLACVRELYETVELRWEPGTVWDYSSLHLKIAGGMAVAASGRSIRELLEETLAELGMTNSYYDMGQNPELAGSLWTTGEDYNKFLESMYLHRVLPAEIVKEMESDHTPSPVVKASKKSWGLGMAVGHYSFANWLECWGSLPEPQPFRLECYEKSIHTSPGVFGYWPLIDRFNNYWMQIVYNGPPIIGCIDGWVARGVIKPVVDAVMGDEKFIPGRKLDIELEKKRLGELLNLDLLAQWPN
ncbi:Beta-lactamase/transpeptidase-like protein [Nannochloropsis gaditana]|uniref:Beta-lactamase/transpeptidase-like protein n=1 Tax=Nannochloropsis gaditana TaxID=72520 RepID=W7U9F9_9STRA|nr:Beta-lactamase/transpeptidase-like protein [Nannochloropsis gaditana]